MQPALNPLNELQRLEALIALDVLDTEPEPEFDALVKAAAAICNTSISLVSLIDIDRQWFKANHGLPGSNQTPRDNAFCTHAILQDGVFEVPDARRDTHFFDNPLVIGDPGIRFYAGAPQRLSSGHAIGMLCVIDREPRQLSARHGERPVSGGEVVRAPRQPGCVDRLAEPQQFRDATEACR